jgi:hypothetical protein
VTAYCIPDRRRLTTVSISIVLVKSGEESLAHRSVCGYSSPPATRQREYLCNANAARYVTLDNSQFRMCGILIHGCTLFRLVRPSRRRGRWAWATYRVGPNRTDTASELPASRHHGHD